VLPPVATGYGLLVILGRAGIIGGYLAPLGIVFAFRWTGAALAAGLMALPLMVRPIRLSIEAIDREVMETAHTLGAPAWVRLARITLPLALPGLAAGALLGFAKALGEFGATITFVGAIPGETLTLPAAIYASTQSPGDENHALALCGVAAVALAVVAVLLSDRLSQAAVRWAGRG
jgi:molybdate transport system permease protein